VASILDCVVQPVWVVDQAGMIQFANPSARAALGYEEVSDLLVKPSHQTIHYKRPDGTAFPAEERPMLLPCTAWQTVPRRGAATRDIGFERGSSHRPARRAWTRHGRADAEDLARRPRCRRQAPGPHTL
jgi:PAS domain-containing protein